MLTPHIKRKKCTKKFYTLPHCTRPTLQKRRRDFTMEQERKEKEEKRRRKKEGSRRPWVCETLRWVSPEGSPLGLSRFFFFFFFPSGDLESPLGLLPEGSRRRSEPKQLAATHLAASRGPAAETHGWVSPAVGFFFFFSLPVGLIFFFFVFRMIKFQIGLTFPSRF
jgi:hypothetical protein